MWLNTPESPVGTIPLFQMFPTCLSSGASCERNHASSFTNLFLPHSFGQSPDRSGLVCVFICASACMCVNAHVCVSVWAFLFMHTCVCVFSHSEATLQGGGSPCSSFSLIRTPLSQIFNCIQIICIKITVYPDLFYLPPKNQICQYFEIKF